MLKICKGKMMKNITFSLLILLLVEIVTCESAIYGFGLGSRYEDDALIFQEELFSNDGDKSTDVNHSIEYTYRALDPVSFIELQTAHNVYTELTFFNAYTIHMKLTEFNSINFNATLYVYGYAGHKPPTDFLAILKSYPKPFDLNKDSIDNILDEALRDYDSMPSAASAKDSNIAKQAKKMTSSVVQQNQWVNRTYFPDYSAVGSSGGSEDYTLFDNNANMCNINWFLLFLLISIWNCFNYII